MSAPPAAGPRHLSRRRVLQGAGLGALTITIGPATLPLASLAAPALAQATEDSELAAFAESIELAAMEAYRIVAFSGRLTTPEVAQTASFFESHHQEHARAFAAEAGDVATGRVNPTLSDMLRSELEQAEDENEVLNLLFDLENAAAATHLYALATFDATPARELAASVLPVEGQHAVALGVALEREVDDVFPVFQTDDRAYDPDRYPLAE